MAYLLLADTDTCSISAQSWNDLCEVTAPRSLEQCRLGLQLVQESAKFLSEHFINKRIYTQVGVFGFGSGRVWSVAWECLGAWLNVTCSCVGVTVFDALRYGCGLT